MNPAAQLSASLLVALGLWAPSLLATLRGELDLPTAAMRYLVGFLLARFGIGLLSRLFITYATTPRPADDPVLDLADGEDVERRRRSDAADGQAA